MMIYNIAAFYLAMVVRFVGYHGHVAGNSAGVANYYLCIVAGDDHQTGAYSRPAEWPLHTLLEATASYDVRSSLILR